jgi:hypothetical protein
MNSRKACTAVTVVVAALGVWSCGGSRESPTTTPAIQGEGREEGTVTSSAVSLVTVCHKGKDLPVPTQALAIHLGHGDHLGSCAAACPCFTSESLTQVAALCSGTVIGSCGTVYSLSLFCLSPVSNLGYFEANLETNTCLTTIKSVTTTRSAEGTQFEACRQAIISDSHYPGTCPDASH